MKLWPISCTQNGKLANPFDDNFGKKEECLDKDLLGNQWELEMVKLLHFSKVARLSSLILRRSLHNKMSKEKFRSNLIIWVTVHRVGQIFKGRHLTVLSVALNSKHSQSYPSRILTFGLGVFGGNKQVTLATPWANSASSIVKSRAKLAFMTKKCPQSFWNCRKYNFVQVPKICSNFFCIQ